VYQPRQAPASTGGNAFVLQGHAPTISDAGSQAAVVAVPDERWGERPVAFVTTSGGAVTERELTEFVRGRLAHFKAPDRVYFEALPKTSTGKIQKYVLRAVARERTRDDGTASARSSGTMGSPGGTA
jgi:acyl-CoA synthetase (AMP-forming)/AMP-acid ligase II